MMVLYSKKQEAGIPTSPSADGYSGQARIKYMPSVASGVRDIIAEVLARLII